MITPIPPSSHEVEATTPFVRWKSCASITSVSNEYRFVMRPSGVVSKNTIGARVLAAGTVSSASLLVIAGSVEERDVLRDVRDEREKRFHPSSGARCFGSRRDGGVFISRAGPGRFAGERAYFERCAPDAEDAFARASDVPTGEGASSDPRAHQSRDAARRRDAFAHEEKGCTLIVFEHSALDRLRERAPGFALAMFARMAANAVEKEIIGAGSTVS